MILYFYQKNCHVFIFFSGFYVLHCWSLLLFYLVAPKGAVCFFVCLVYPPSPSVQAFSNRLADRSLASYWSHKSNSLVWRSRYLRRWILLSFLSDTRRICRAVSLASLYRSWSRRYKGSCPRPQARRLRLWCHPSMSLLVLTAFLNTVQSTGLQIVPLIQLPVTYSACVQWNTHPCSFTCGITVLRAAHTALRA